MHQKHIGIAKSKGCTTHFTHAIPTKPFKKGKVKAPEKKKKKKKNSKNDRTKHPPINFQNKKRGHQRHHQHNADGQRSERFSKDRGRRNLEDHQDHLQPAISGKKTGEKNYLVRQPLTTSPPLFSVLSSCFLLCVFSPKKLGSPQPQLGNLVL